MAKKVSLQMKLLLFPVDLTLPGIELQRVGAATEKDLVPNNRNRTICL